MKVEASFVRSAASVSDLPHDGLSEIALVGRSNVGKSSLINALVRQRVARTSAAPGKTRLANIYRVARGGGSPLYLVDLPGYGYARGGREAAAGFEELTRAFFRRAMVGGCDDGDGRRVPVTAAAAEVPISALLLVDSRHPGLASDLAAWNWLCRTVDSAAIVTTKIDKLPRGQRIRALGEWESVIEHPVLPVSAVTGEGLDELWILIDRLANNPKRLRSRSRPSRPPEPAAAPRTKATRARPKR